MKLRAASVMMSVVGIGTLLGGLANFFGAEDGAMIIAGAILLAGGTVSVSLAKLVDSRAQRNHSNKSG